MQTVAFLGTLADQLASRLATSESSFQLNRACRWFHRERAEGEDRDLTMITSGYCDAGEDGDASPCYEEHLRALCAAERSVVVVDGDDYRALQLLGTRGNPSYRRDGSRILLDLISAHCGGARLCVACVALDRIPDAASRRLRFDEFKQELLRSIRRVDPAGAKTIAVVPILLGTGANIAEATGELDFYDGQSLLDVIRAQEPVLALSDAAPLRLSVGACFPRLGRRRRRRRRRRTEDTATVVGTILSGQIHEGQRLSISPMGEPATVLSLQSFGRPVRSASAGESVGVRLRVSREACVRGGMVLCCLQEPLGSVERFTAHVIITARRSQLRVGSEPVVRIQGGMRACRVKALLQRLDKRSGGVVEESPRQISTGQAGMAVFEPIGPMTATVYDKEWGHGRARLGRAMLFYQDQLLGAACIKESSNRTAHQDFLRSRGLTRWTYLGPVLSLRKLHAVGRAFPAAPEDVVCRLVAGVSSEWCFREVARFL